MEGLHVPKGKGARKPLRLRKWQKEIVRAGLAPGIRTAVVAMSSSPVTPLVVAA